MKLISSACLILASCAAIGAACAWADGQASPPADGTAPASVSGSDTPAKVALGPRFESLSAGITLSPPASMRLVNRIGENSVAEWSNDEFTWRLVLSQFVQPSALPLVTGPDNFGKETPGLLETTVDKHKAMHPGVLILRQDVTNIADGGVPDPRHANVKRPNVGLIVMRYTDGAMRYLTQQALIQSSPRVFYIVTLTTPGGKGLTADSPIEPVEQEAAAAFSAMLDSIRLTDRGAIRMDQNDRLDRTRAFLVNLISPVRLRNALIREQWLRIIRNGKDIGYTYITEDTAAAIPRKLTPAEVRDGKSVRDLIRPGDGILIGMRARIIEEGIRSDKTKGEIQTDSANWFFVSGDARHEDWSRLIVTDDHVNPDKNYLEEIGTSDKRQRPKIVIEPDPQPGQLPAGKRPEPGMTTVDDYELDVTLMTNQQAPMPIRRSVVPWYIPQAVVQLLPRLMDRKIAEPKKYLFACYVSEPTRQVMHRYVDVLPAQSVTFNNQIMRAVQIKERLGLDGQVTTHYLSEDGTYLGSDTPSEKTIVLPTDAATLANIWKNAILSSPDGTDRTGQNHARPPEERTTVPR